MACHVLSFHNLWNPEVTLVFFYNPAGRSKEIYPKTKMSKGGEGWIMEPVSFDPYSP